MLKFIESILPYRPWSFGDYVIMLICGIAILLVAALLFCAIAALCKLIFYEASYAAIKTYKGEVIDMNYVPPRTTTHFNGKTTTTSTTPEKNIVIIKTDIKTTELDSDKLYQRVRVGESVTVKSQDKFIRPRYWSGQWETDGVKLISVTSEKNQTVNFNDEEPARYHGTGTW